MLFLCLWFLFSLWLSSVSFYQHICITSLFFSLPSQTVRYIRSRKQAREKNCTRSSFWDEDDMIITAFYHTAHKLKYAIFKQNRTMESILQKTLHCDIENGTHRSSLECIHISAPECNSTTQQKISYLAIFYLISAAPCLLEKKIKQTNPRLFESYTFLPVTDLRVQTHRLISYWRVTNNVCSSW